MNADHSLIDFRHSVLEEVARLAFAGELEEKVEYLPEIMDPGPFPTHRCCVYRERAITRERIRVSMDLSPDPVDNGNIIQVLDSACADCQLSGYLVTDLCQNCAGRACIESCKFGAIESGKLRTEIDRHECRECGMCAKACQFNAIVHVHRPCRRACPVDALTYDEHGLAMIDEKKCIRCGQCVHSCPFGAISTRSSIVQVIEALKGERPVYAMIAPAAEGQYGKDITMSSFRKAAKEVGFADLYEVGLGADLTAAAEAVEWKEAYEEGRTVTTSCCPAFVNLINQHYPDLSQYISTAVSPMCQLSRMIKSKEPEALTVFIGPCVAKKSEVKDHKIEGNADWALVFSEFEALMKARDVELKPAEDIGQQSSIFGKRFAQTGGVADSCLEYLEECDFDEDLSVLTASGAEELKKVLTLLEKGKLKEQFIEGMCCEGGCFNGPSSYDCGPKAKRARDHLLDQADDRSIRDSIGDVDTKAFSGYRA